MKRKLFWTAGTVVITAVIVVLVIILVKYVAGPEIVRSKAAGEIGKMWGGPVRVEGVTFNYTEPILVENIVLSDEQGREWVALRGITVELEGLLRGKTGIRGVEVDELVGDVYVDGRQVNAPLKPGGEEKKEKAKPARIDHVRIKDGELRLHTEKGDEAFYDDLSLMAERTADRYEINFEQKRTEMGDYALVKGTAGLGGDSPDVDLRWEGERALTPVEAELLLGLFEVDWVETVEGGAKWGFDLRGKIAELEKGLIEGRGEIKDLRLVGREDVLIDGGSFIIEGNNDRFEIRDGKANFCCGSLDYNGYVRPGGEHFAEHGGVVKLTNLDLKQLGANVPNVREFSQGSGNFRCEYSMQGGAMETLSGDGALMLEDADLGSMPIISAIFKTLGLGSFDPLASADVATQFTAEGPVLTFQKGQVGSSLAAVNMQEGGTINMQTKHMDFYVVGTVLGEVEDFFGKLPIAELFVEAKGKLTRLRVEGKWTDPPMELISKQPLEDVGEATLGFFKGVLDTGGDLGKGVLDVLGF
ncbi:putative protein involved in outer membrane biogenesis [Anaerohalosphaera lusitana]|uniref:AsmA-like C-terminal domain-containing protein n=1 Tax=Anaerohalosphaera lusitana TaxID=1936003 RepID=A0A1U9NJX8_9BACT|nr:hypothetical protein [Anaerohalosphaera lusitana]AQT68044.1 putative protein involved in outer membrane biogenesis [Anaerohalosphaera lusitana]